MQQLNQYVRVGHVTKAPLYFLFFGAIGLIGVSLYIANTRAQENDEALVNHESQSGFKSQAQSNIVTYLEKVAKDNLIEVPDNSNNKSEQYFLDMYQDKYEQEPSTSSDDMWSYQFDPMPSAEDQLKASINSARAQALMQALRAQTTVSVPSKKDAMHKQTQGYGSSAETNGNYALANNQSFAQSYVNGAADKLAKLQMISAQNQGYDQGYGSYNGINPSAGQVPGNINSHQTLSAYQNLVNNDTTMMGQMEEVLSPYLVRQGAVIPCTLLTGINSDLPGLVQAQVNEDVYDSPEGRHLLIPKGSKVIGQYASSPMMGQERLMMAFNRIIFPDGKAMSLGAMPGSSLDGYSGFNADVDNHFMKLLGNAVLLGGVTAGISLSVDDKRDENGDLTINGALSQSLGQSLGRVLTNVIERNLNTSPTLKVQPGFAFNVTLVKDIYFNGPYRHYQQSART